MKFRRQSRINNGIDITPLIDVVFILLIFFMVTTTFTRETLLQVELPEAEGEPAAEQADVIEVTVAADGSYGVNGQPLAARDARTLRAAILEAGGDNAERPFAITADAQSPHQAVVTVMDVAGKLNFRQLSITTRQPED